MLNIKRATAILNDDESAQSEAEKFRRGMDTFWATRIAKLARVVLLERQFNKEMYLPHPEDLKTLNGLTEHLSFR